MNCDAVLRVVCRTTHRTLNDAIPSFVHISVHSNNDLTACGLRAAVRSNGTLLKSPSTYKKRPSFRVAQFGLDERRRRLPLRWNTAS